MSTSRARARRLARRLSALYPEAACELVHSSDLELLVATMLSAQCTDAMVNRVTPALFRRFRRPSDYYGAPLEELELAIRPTGFYHTKARHIRAACQALDERYGGRVPSAMEELLTLPGVARKTAHCVRGNWFGLPAITVDTHVGRLSRRLGLSAHQDPTRVEADLRALLPEAEWTAFSHRLIQHGRRVCHARKPDCPRCPLARTCPSAGGFRK